MFRWIDDDSSEAGSYRCEIADNLCLRVHPAAQGAWEGVMQAGDSVVRRQTGLATADAAKNAIVRAYLEFVNQCVTGMGGSIVKKKLILIIDDEKDFADVVERFLAKTGYRVLKADHGEQALEIMKHNDVDLILTDLKMPVMDGEAFVHTLLKRYASEKPVIVFTGHGSVKKARELLELGVQDFMSNPVDFMQLEATMRNALARFETLRN